MFSAIDAVVLARAQFAFTMTFHIVFPAFSIGLASYLAVLEALWLWTGRAVFLDLFKYWLKIFAIALRHGRRLRHRDVLPVRHQLVGVLRQDRARDRPADGLRGADRVLPRSGLPRRHAVRHGAGRPRAAFRRDADGRDRHADLGVLDPVGEFLDADAGGLHDQRRRPVLSGRLAGGDLQPVIPLSPRAHGAGGLPDHGAGGRRDRRVSPAARLRQRRGARHVLDGDVDGDAGGAGPDRRRRPARAQHARASAGEDHGDGGPFPRAIPTARR